jgi:gamma-glutamyltranspeptidase/glutathione hydrolase
MAPGKRPMHTLNAYTVLKNGRPLIVGGTPGTDFQVQCNLQMITGIIDHGISPQVLLDAPRWQSTPGSEPPMLGDPFAVLLEPRMPQEVGDELRALGHTVAADPKGEVNLGRVQLIQVNQDTGVMMGASDARADGHAVAL